MRDKLRYGPHESGGRGVVRVQSSHDCVDGFGVDWDVGWLELSRTVSKTNTIILAQVSVRNHLDEKKNAFPSRSFLPPSE
jgi:hypothetical protein